MSTRVVVTGIGIVSPLGRTATWFFDALVQGRSGLSRCRAGGGPRLVGAVDQVEDELTAQQARHLDRVSRFALAAARQAIWHAGLEGRGLGERSGVFLGTGMGGAETIERSYAEFFGVPDAEKPLLTVPRAMNHAPAAHIAIRHGVTGECLTYSTACSSSSVAIGEAFRHIREGRLDLALAGGSEALLTPAVLREWSAMKVLCADPEDAPGTGCRPFSADRSGFALAEGAAVLVLESLAHATRRQATPWAGVVGYGASSDACHLTRPNAGGQARAIARALADAGLEPAQIGYINAHGTATRAGDVIETQAIKQALGAYAARIPVSSTKSAHGHLMGAAGAIEFAATVLALQRQVVPPTTHWTLRDPQCDLDHVPGRGRAVDGLTHAMSNSFAFGGSNAVLVARRWS